MAARVAHQGCCSSASTLHTRLRHHGLACRKHSSIRISATGGEDLGGVSTSKPIYQGVYGTYTIESTDVTEVTLYRAGINVAAAAAVTSAAAALLPPDSPLHGQLVAALDPLFLVGAAGLGLSLQLIHIYVDPLKKALQLMWAVGLAGAAGIMVMQDVPAAVYVFEHPVAVWLVGPFFAALTGVAFKEGFCYNKWEAAGLFGTIPLLLLGHLTQLLPVEGERGMLAAFAVLFTVFAGRKWTQQVKDDIGDKSVFEFLKLPEEQQQRLLELRGVRTEKDEE
mmetsp:Transcript_23869/g.52277  ORF Transcript_23869/g.52277 Transcript_23869/m.52277 type:complete len:280 (-) Transcript_23869:96-935(-)|eukprot:CAMPEP_0202923682 /NCGR_PEP_ID=MMETSP1392-20130828/78578_1 /ASSEMBLY_ACC=CAM_ASM_000868 /TAXON_ID=225041 /ORGANISM="Chlamydomonas chlamydogama, Strain SAG 11-48b" /LENGTH=279 /DNA_ID=CAMNT_0049617377 /DNA_START=45 /DNA_END=884 /DNA_ORIENTATION=+